MNTIKQMLAPAVILCALSASAQTLTTSAPGGHYEIKGPSVYDGATKFYITNNATAYGRTNLILTGRFEHSNDAWTFGSGARNSIVFAQNLPAVDGADIGVPGTEKFSLQVEGNSNSLGFLSAGRGNAPVMTLTQAGTAGIGTTSPRAGLDVALANTNGYSSVLGRLSEGNGIGDGTFLGVKIGNTQPSGAMAFSLQHGFYGVVNSTISFHRGGGQSGGFMTFGTNDGSEKMRLDASGNLSIGVTNPQGNKLEVNGTVMAKKIKVTQGFADYVFDSSYRLRSLKEVEQFIHINKHLPGMPSASEVSAKGLDLGDVCRLQQEKIEELTLYLIVEQQAKSKLESRLEVQEQKMKVLEQAVEKLLLKINCK